MGAHAASESHERPPSNPEPDTGDNTRAGEIIANRFRIAARIHTSSTGTVYRAEDLSLARPVALRLLTPMLSRDQTVLERLQGRLHASMRMARDEVRVLSDIVDLIDIGRSEDGQVFVVTDFIAGDNLAQQLAHDGPLAWTAVRPLMVRACQILHLSHEHGVVRLDLQTRHLFPVRDKNQTSTLKILSPGLQLDPALSPEMIRYAAPEQITRAGVDRRTDIYALGVIMYELLTGSVPFADPVPAVVLARHLLEPPPPLPHHILAEVPTAALAIVHRALAKHPDDRWPTMKAMANAMAAIDFGPCDVSGMLEVVDGEVSLPSTSATSMRIDPSSSRSGLTPSVRPRTFPPLQSAFMADSHAPDESSSQMAWEEILEAAEEAIAIATAGHHSGTSGDSGVFLPERLLHTGEAASASQHRGRKPAPIPEPSLAETLVLPIVRPEAPTEPTMQLGPDDLMADSHVALLLTADAAAAAAVVEPGPPIAPTLSRTDTSGSAPRTHGGEPSEESAATLHYSPAERSAAAWQRSAPTPSERRPRLAWAAGLLLLVLAGAAAVRMTRAPSDDRADRTAAGPDLSARTASSTVTNLAPGTGSVARTNTTPAAAPPGAANLAPETADAAVDTKPNLPRGTGPTATAVAADTKPNLAPGTGASAVAEDPNLAPGTAASATAGPPTNLAPETADNHAPGPASGADLAAGTAANTAPSAARVPAPRTTPRPPRATPPPPPPPQRKTAPGAQAPDAGHESLTSVQDPIRAAALLTSAEQAAARGEHGQALGLAIQSFHAAPTARSLQVAGEAACRLGNVGKAKWAHQHLAARDRGPVEAVCTASGVALD